MDPFAALRGQPRSVRLAWVAGASLIAATASGASAQTTYYVAPPPAGNDSNAGTAAAPFATLQRGANATTAGDTVIVLPGTYAGFNIGVTRSGQPGAPITFSAMPGVLVNTAAATFNGQAHKARINMDSTSWIVIEGFEVTGSNDQRVSKAGIRAVCPPGGAFGHITIRNNHVHHNGEWGIFTGHMNAVTVEGNLVHEQYDEHGVYLSNSGDDHIVRENVIHSNSSQGLHVNSDASQGGDGVMTNVMVERNTIYNNAVGSTYIDGAGVMRTSTGGGSAINFDGVQNSVIRNNLLYENHASGISLYRIDGLLGASNNLVVNNTIVQASNGRWCLNISDASTGNTVFNNILLNYHSFRGSIIITADSFPLVSDCNIVMDRLDPDGDGPTPNLTLAQWRAQTGQDQHSIALAQGAWAGLFVNLAGADYRLTAASTARDTGTRFVNGREAPRVDRTGARRSIWPQYDVGAYEWRPACAGDCNADGIISAQDIFLFLALWFGGDPGADWNLSGVADSGDLFAFLAAWFTPCP